MVVVVLVVVVVFEMVMMIVSGDSAGGGGDIGVGGDGYHKSRKTAAVLHFFGTKQIICCHQMAVPLT